VDEFERFPWSRRPDESEKAYAYFKHFLEQEHPRIVTKTAEHFTRSNVDRYVTAYEWRARAEAYDLHQTAIEAHNRHITVAALREMQEHIIAKEIEAYQILEAAWVELAEQVQALSDLELPKQVRMFKDIVLTRERIDKMVRRTARMPEQYIPVPAEDRLYKDDDEIYLDESKGPMLIDG